MESIIKGFLGVFFIVVLTFLGVGLIGASMESRNADTFLSDSARRIENSNFSEEVIQSCKSDAKERGYTLTVDAIKPGDRSRPVYGTLSMEYEFRIPVLFFSKKQRIQEDLL